MEKAVLQRISVEIKANDQWCVYRIIVSIKQYQNRNWSILDWKIRYLSKKISSIELKIKNLA